jgi:frataxin-like iron-binding protein CyaY
MYDKYESVFGGVISSTITNMTLAYKKVVALSLNATPQSWQYTFTTTEPINTNYLYTQANYSIKFNNDTFSNTCYITHMSMDEQHRPQYTCIDAINAMNKNGDFVYGFHKNLSNMIANFSKLYVDDNTSVNFLWLLAKLVGYKYTIQQKGMDTDCANAHIGLFNVKIKQQQYTFLIETIRNAVSNFTPPYDVIKQIALIYGLMPVITNANELTLINPLALSVQDIKEYLTTYNDDGTTSTTEESMWFPKRKVDVYPMAVGGRAYIVNDATHTVMSHATLKFDSRWSMILNGYQADGALQTLISAFLSGFYQRKIETVRPIWPSYLLGKVYYDSVASTRILITNVNLSISEGKVKTTFGGVYFPSYLSCYDISYDSDIRRTFAAETSSSSNESYEY